MEFSNEHFLKLKEKKKIAMRNAQYLYALSSEYMNIKKQYTDSFYRRAERILNCLSYWEWDRYKINKVLNLRKVSRCKDVFCPNCRSVNVYKAIINFTPAFNEMMAYRYNPYLMTLTVPNIKREDLSSEIDKMNKAFIKFWRWLYKPFSKNGSYYGGYKERLFDSKGAIKVLEVTLQRSDWNYFNIHFHVIVFLENEFPGDFFKKIDGGYQYRTKSFIYYSDADIFIQKLWKMAYDKKDISFFSEASDDWQDNYVCDIRELSMPKGIYEVFKYCFKDLDIRNQEIFRDLCDFPPTMYHF
ncbi:MAG: protein rep [Actinobacteria bacterium]|nr:protein rep [Actinomycetota bacterium]